MIWLCSAKQSGHHRWGALSPIFIAVIVGTITGPPLGWSPCVQTCLLLNLPIRCHDWPGAAARSKFVRPRDLVRRAKLLCSDFAHTKPRIASRLRIYGTPEPGVRSFIWQRLRSDGRGNHHSRVTFLGTLGLLQRTVQQTSNSRCGRDDDALRRDLIEHCE